MGSKADRCQRAQVSELFSMEISDMAVIDLLAAMDVGMFPLGGGTEAGAASHSFPLSLSSVSGDEG